jgi:hypothetical protein
VENKTGGALADGADANEVYYQAVYANVTPG